MAEPDYILDIDGLGGEAGSAKSRQERVDRAGLRGESWLAMRWRCCGAYGRIYRNKQQTAYEGRCPRCGRPVSVKIGPDGTRHRFFEAY